MNTKKTTGPSVGRFYILLLSACLLLASFVGCGASGEADPYQTVGEIDGRPVALGELQLFVDDVRQQTNSYFKKNHQLDAVTEKEWKQDFDGEAPVDHAIQLAMQELVPYKVVEEKLAEQGSREDFSYRAFVERWQKENEDRQQKKDAGEVIYGPVQYTERVYYDYLNDSYKEELETTMQTEPKETDLQKLYEEHPDLFQTFGSVTMACAVLPQESYAKEQAEAARETILYAMEGGSSFAQGAAQAGISENVQERTFTADDLTSPDVANFPEVEDAVYSLKQGETTELIDNGGLQWLFFYCENRQEGGRTPFAECRDALKEMYREQTFDMELQQAQASAQITIYDEARDEIH